MPKREDISGLVCGKLLVLEFSHKSIHGRSQWRCLCECGNTTVVDKTKLISGKTKSCGCISLNLLKERSISHGMSNTPLHVKWKAIKARCYNPNNVSYPIYGGRGVEVCEEWKTNFNTFYAWAMENNWEKGLSIERIDVNGNYCPENCKLIPQSQQGWNKRNTLKVIFNGVPTCLGEVIKVSGTSFGYCRLRHWILSRGISFEEAVEICERIDNGLGVAEGDLGG